MVHLSPFYFQKCFKMVTGYTVGEYLRNRRLYLAGLEVLGRVDYREDVWNKSPDGSRSCVLSPISLRFFFH